MPALQSLLLSIFSPARIESITSRTMDISKTDLLDNEMRESEEDTNDREDSTDEVVQYQ